jgi:hypothetical protein
MTPPTDAELIADALETAKAAVFWWEDQHGCCEGRNDETGVLGKIDTALARLTAISAQAELLKRATNIMSFHAGRCPLHPNTNYSGSEEHLSEYRNVVRDIDAALAALEPYKKGTHDGK